MRNERISRREQGIALLIVIIAGTGIIAISAVSVTLTIGHRVTQDSQRAAFYARQVADSGIAQAVTRIRQAGIITPHSGTGANAAWVSFSEGDFVYNTTFDPTNNLSTIRGWGRIAVTASPSTSAVTPDDLSWDDTGWMVQGAEVSVHATKYIPTSPVYFGNGGIERPDGGFDWSGGSDLFDPSTWNTVSSGASSYQDSDVPFSASALDWPQDYLYSGGTPTPASSNPHPYNIWASQTPVGQFNVEAWFANSAGSGDPTSGLTPPPTNTFYDTSDPTSPDHPYPVDTSIPDVQDFSHTLWNTYHTDPDANLLTSGSHNGTYGDLANPAVTFVTGELQVNAGETFKGAGVLVIRDDYDPNVNSNNTPGTEAGLDINGTFEWTGLVIIAGWRPTVDLDKGADATIVGALFGEDSVQSGGEISLDTATIIMRVRDDFKVLYSNGLFAPGGPINQFLPFVNKEVVGYRNL
jgi:hypothetical protein